MGECGCFVAVRAEYMLTNTQWISGAGDPRNKIHIVLAVTDPSNPSPHKRHSLVIVEPSQQGVNIVRPMQVFGYDDAPEGHCEVIYKDVRVPVSSVVGGKDGLGKGFAVSCDSRQRRRHRRRFADRATDHSGASRPRSIASLHAIDRHCFEVAQPTDAACLGSCAKDVWQAAARAWYVAALGASRDSPLTHIRRHRPCGHRSVSVRDRPGSNARPRGCEAD